VVRIPSAGPPFLMKDAAGKVVEWWVWVNIQRKVRVEPLPTGQPKLLPLAEADEAS